MPDSVTIASAVSATPYYRDWSLWSAGIALVALGFSVAPVLWRWLRPPKLELELFDRIGLTHKVGNPNLQAHFTVRNVGGREVRVTTVTAVIKRENSEGVALPARSYLQSGSSQLLFTPFNLRSHDEWANIVNFYPWMEREDDQRYRRLESALKADITQKLIARPPGSNELVMADPASVAPLIQMYEGNNLRWRTGQYELTIKVTTTLKQVGIEQSYRFALFEGDIEDLRLVTEDYKMGWGIYLDNPVRNTFVFPSIVRV